MTVIVQKFEADWCAPCKNQSKIMEEVEDIFRDEDVEFKSIDIDSEEGQKKATENGVKSIPTILIKQEGDKPSEKFIGLTKADTLKEAIDKVLN